MDRKAFALIQAAMGRGGTRQFRTRRVEEFDTDTAIDTDADAFTVTIGDPAGEFLFLTERDVESRVTIYTSNTSGKTVPIFTGYTDDATYSTTGGLLTLTGRDLSALAVDSDAPPGKWRHVKPAAFITQRAHNVGLTNVKAAKMREISTLYTDATEKEWAFWYRIARSRGMFMWTDPLGTLYVDHLGYSAAPSYKFGIPGKNQKDQGWVTPIEVAIRSRKQGRKRRVWVYGEDAKSGRPFFAQGIDTSIKSWKRQPLAIQTSSVAKSNSEAKDEADEEVFESIVGAYEIELTFHDIGLLIAQNRMCRFNMPEYPELSGVYFVVGVQRRGGPEGFIQTVRLRERGFALSKRVPEAPTITAPKDPARNATPASIAGILSQTTTPEGKQLPWANYFVDATNEFGVPAGWDTAVFLGVLLSIAEHETGFRNVRGSVTGAINDVPWVSWSEYYDAHVKSGGQSQTYWRDQYELTFANSIKNPKNPRYPNSECAVGVMQLVTLEFKEWADQYGWNGNPKPGELEGGRWNPRSNIRAAARAFVGKLEAAHADPNKANTIWLGVAKYYGSKDAAQNEAYVNAVKKVYDSTFGQAAQTAIAGAKSVPPGTQTKIDIKGHGTIEVPDAPDEVKKAINIAIRHLGDYYEYGGSGPRYDCSSFVTMAIGGASPSLRAKFDMPHPPNHHGETTYTLFAKGRFKSVTKDNLKPGDLVFFIHPGGSTPEHVGMYVADGFMIDDPHTGAQVRWQSINTDYFRSTYLGARRLFDWPFLDNATAAQNANKHVVMIQAGHDPGSNADQPYGHTGESGAAGELAFTREVRDNVVALLDADPRFDGRKGTAWSASAGATSLASDDVDFSGDLFVSIHYDKGTAGSGYFFGYTRGATDGRSAAMSESSAKLADKIAAEINKISGAPPRLTDNTNFGGSPANATGWGYYAWGSSQRATPDNVNHLPGIDAAVIMECGRASDASYLTNRRGSIAKAIYNGICAYYGVKPNA
jgi:cell wall-associated NlpC family hydrolase